MAALFETALEGLPKRSGKVRDVYDLGGRTEYGDNVLLIVASDRISAFDWILPDAIPGKGCVLTLLSDFWFERLGVPNHLVPFRIKNVAHRLDLTSTDALALRDRARLVRKAKVVPFECVVRGYLEGSGWKEYKATGSVCGERLPPGLVQGDRIDPIFTPATKAESGHDENVPFAAMVDAIGHELANLLREKSLDVYSRAAEYARSKGLILADTKFEWGHDVETGELLLVDEVLTPDSSRYWDASAYKPGGPQPSFDKQFVRDWLETTGWDKQSPPPHLPEDVVMKTRQKYIDAYERLTGQPFPWK